MSWQENFKGTLKRGFALKNFTTLRVGGNADFFAQPKDNPDLKLLITSLKRYRIPFFIIGAGSNLLVSDRGVRGCVIKLNSPAFMKIRFFKDSVEVGAGVFIPRLIGACANKGFGRTEFLAGIPGTVGGALLMNAGAWGKSIGDLVKSITVIDRNAKLRVLKNKDIKFAYRKSNLDKFIITGAVLKLTKKPKASIKKDIQGYLDARRAKQDITLPNAGCIFKNPKNDSAGRLIEQAGFKGKKLGCVCVSNKHANFILNSGNASAADILNLMRLIRLRVKRKFRINLEPEIKIWQ